MSTNHGHVAYPDQNLSRQPEKKIPRCQYKLLTLQHKLSFRGVASEKRDFFGIRDIYIYLVRQIRYIYIFFETAVGLAELVL